MNRLLLVILLFLLGCNSQNPICDGNCDNGFGIKRWDDGGYIKGNWKNGTIVGVGYKFWGTSSIFSGDIYQGYFNKDEVEEGFGKYYSNHQNGTQAGQWKNGKPDGYSILVFGLHSEHPHRIYDGGWKDGKYNGFGILYLGDNGPYAHNKYIGYYINGKMDGLGNYYWANGCHYSGQWKNGLMNGEGTFTFQDSMKYKSHWQEGYDPYMKKIVEWRKKQSLKTDTIQFYYR